jgi:5-methylcytosine-specific restriction protein B
VDGAGRRYSDDYAWYAKYGSNAEEAFRAVKKVIEKVAKAARDGELQTIDKADLGTSVKWKLAFLYQGREDLKILPIYKESHLKAYLGSTGKTAMSALYARVLKDRKDEELFGFARRVWKAATEKLNVGILTVPQAQDYLDERFEASPEPEKKLAGFVTDPGKELALVLNNKAVTLFLANGAWTREGVRLTKEFHAGEKPHADLKTQAPSLASGPACTVEVKTMKALEALCDAYEGPKVVNKDSSGKRLSAGAIPLNQILFGPPGTGKTFSSINKALEILDPAFLDVNADNRSALKGRFDEFLQEKRVQLVTFHQSFSYEDFVEGISASSDDGESAKLKYKVEPGVFARICNDARLRSMVKSTSVTSGSRVWKISIGQRHKDVELREECFKRGEARIGWGHVGDLSNPERPKAEFANLEAESDTNQNSLNSFYEGVSVGDILLCLATNKTIQAVGVVEGEYEFDDSVKDTDFWGTYFHKRRVRWLAKGLDADILALNDGVTLTQKTIYELSRISAPDALKLANVSEPVGGNAEPYVLIIDEINRGNVSRIFGELITLLEPSKRQGAPEALEAILPYSKKPFAIPQNLYIIGTMNTADRSLATLDIALRRRFEFIEVPSDPQELSDIHIDGIDVAAMLTVMNQRIEVLLDRDHALGHAYFMSLRKDSTLSELAGIFRTRVLPLLQEYFFEDWERIRWVLNDHRKKHAPHEFVVRPEYDVQALLGEGPEIPKESRQWRINPDAFELADSFRKIIEVR